MKSVYASSGFLLAYSLQPTAYGLSHASSERGT